MLCCAESLSCVRLCATLWIIACQSPLSMGFSRQEYRSGLPCLPLGDLSDPGIETVSLISATLAGIFFTTGATWEAWGISRTSLRVLSPRSKSSLRRKNDLASLFIFMGIQDMEMEGFILCSRGLKSQRTGGKFGETGNSHAPGTVLCWWQLIP